MKRLCLFAVVPLVFTGCFLDGLTTVARPQLDDTIANDEKIILVSQVADTFDNAAEVVVSGFGIVIGLNGNGGVTPPCDAKSAVVERLKRDKVEEIPAVVDSPNNAIVILTAVVRPGVRRHELVDIHVSLPQGSKVKSLRGGVLMPCPLMTFASQTEVREYLKNSDFNSTTEGNRMLRGHDVLIARGPLQGSLTGTESAAIDTEKPLKEAHVWKGGKMIDGRAMFLVLNPDQQRFRISEEVSNRINETFHAGESAGAKFALAKHKDVVAISVPPRYRLNRPHFMRVVRAIPLTLPTEQGSYISHLERELQKPETALSAAVGLEAIGGPAVATLRAALTSEYPLVRFAAAESLAYLGHPVGAEVLQKIAAEHPALQAYALTALAALDDALGQQKLEELLISKEPELRYGAFRALREMDAKGDMVRGEWVKHAFTIHPVPVSGPSMIHLLREGGAEIVLFGENPKLSAPFSLAAGPEMTITARPGDTVATISRFSAKTAVPVHVQSSLDVADILRKLGELGGNYSDAAEFLQKARDRKVLTAKLVLDALPKAVPIVRLAKAAREDPKMEMEYDLLAEVDAANAPNLFEATTSAKRN